MKPFLILLALCFVTLITNAQVKVIHGDTVYNQRGIEVHQWHQASDTLRGPGGPGHKYYMATKYFNRYDTIPCIYALKLNNTLIVSHGFKKVFLFDAFYTDDSTTMDKFFDSAHHPVKGVERYCFF